METAMNASSVLEVFVIIAVGFAVVVSGVRSKWKYISQVGDIQSEIKVRVRRLAILYVISIVGTALSLVILILSRSIVLSIVALVFAVICVFAHIFIDLDTSKR